jgi:hypothetical protein
MLSEQEAIQSAIKICERWLRKFKKNYNPDKSIDILFDRFFTLFVSYNALYCAINLFTKATNKQNNISATQNVPEYLGHSNLAKTLLCDEEIKQGIEQIINLIDKEIFYIHSKKDDPKNSQYNIPDLEEDKKHINNIKKALVENYDVLDKSILKEFTQSLLTLIYKTRCNMFHGSKQIDNLQRNLLIPMNAILVKIIELGLDKLKQEAK